MRIPSFFLAAGFVLIAAGCNSSAQPLDGPSATPVLTVQAVTADSPLPIRAVGTLGHGQSATLSFKIGGPVASVLAEEGQRVQRGQVLARLLTGEIDAAVEQATAAREKALRDVNRLRRLYADSVVTLEQLQNAETGLQVASAGLQSASFNRAYADIVSPGSGVIKTRFAEPGELVGPGQPVLEVGLDGAWVLRTGLADRDVVRIRPGTPASLRFDALPGRTFEGSVSQVGSTSDPRTGTFEVEVTVDDPSGSLRSGLIGRASIQVSGSSGLVALPVDALTRASGKTGTVFVADLSIGVALSRTVQIAQIESSRILISSGVKAGESVITRGAAYLHDGSSISVGQ